MKFEYNDGGRSEAGFKGNAGDCVTRAIVIASGLPYREVYDALAEGSANQRASKHTPKRSRSARNGINVKRKWFKDYMKSIGFKWVPTMQIGSGCKVHLHDGELPNGRLIVSVSKHYTTVIDGVVHDTHDPQREINNCEPDHGGKLKPGQSRNVNGIWSISRRCVYGYWIKEIQNPHNCSAHINPFNY